MAIIGLRVRQLDWSRKVTAEKAGRRRLFCLSDSQHGPLGSSCLGGKPPRNPPLRPTGPRRNDPDGSRSHNAGTPRAPVYGGPAQPSNQTHTRIGIICLTVARYSAERRGNVSRTATIGDACIPFRLPIQKWRDVAASPNCGAKRLP
jgi:hypothetical protein